MLKTLQQTIGRYLQRGQPDTQRAAQHWDQWQAQRSAAPTAYTDWGDHPTLLGLVQEAAFGSPEVTVFHYLLSRYPQFAQARAISLCSGDGAFEKLLVQHGVFGEVVGTDIAPARVEAANASRGELAGRLSFQVADVNQADFGEAQYDVVFAKAALHHVENLEGLFAGIRRGLRPGGRLVTIDFFGPTRFQWTDRQIDLANRFLDDHVPVPLKQRADGTVHRVERPTVAAMIAMDPSEAVRASEVHDLLAQHLSIKASFDIGGTLLNLIFDPSIVNNFEAGRAEHDDILRRAFVHERDLIARGELPSDFKFLIAQA